MALNKNEIRTNPRSAIELYHLFLGKPQCSQVDDFYVSDKHVHKEIEMVFALSGEVEVLVDRNLYRVAQGEMLSICGYALHQYQQKKPDTNLIKLKFLREWLSLPFLEPEEAEKVDRLYRQVFHARMDEGMLAILTALFHCPLKSYQSMYCQGKIFEMTAYLMDHPELIISERNTDLSSERYLEQAITYMQENCCEKLSLKMMADHLGLTETYCSKYIKKKTGLTFVEYLNTLRVNRAQRLLWATDFSISEIAELVGFSSVQTFNRVFKPLSSQLSPSEYRRLKQKRNGVIRK